MSARNIRILTDRLVKHMRQETMEFQETTRKIRPGRIVFYMIAGLVILSLILVLLQVLLTRSNGQPPHFFGHGIYLMSNDSMEPTVHPGEALWVTEQPMENYLPGDVIVFKDGVDAGGQIILRTSRISSVETDENGAIFFRTQGDAAAEMDSTPCDASMICGKVERIMPLMGSFLNFIRTPFGLVVCIAVPLGILLIIEIINLIVVSRRTREEEEEESFYTTPKFHAEAAPDLGGDYGDLGARPLISYKVDESTPSSLSELPPLNLPKKSSQSAPAPIQTTRQWQTGSSRPAARSSVPREADSLVNTRRYNTVSPQSEAPAPAISPFTKRPLPSASSHTREFSALPQQPKPSAPPAVRSELPPLEKKPVTETPPPVAAPAPKPVATGDKVPDFAANLASHGRDHFQIDGIDVRVRPDAIKLALPEDTSERDISITVTNEYTNVTIGCKGEEVNFALFRDEKDDQQKVIIQKKRQ